MRIGKVRCESPADKVPRDTVCWRFCGHGRGVRRWWWSDPSADSAEWAVLDVLTKWDVCVRDERPGWRRILHAGWQLHGEWIRRDQRWRAGLQQRHPGRECDAGDYGRQLHHRYEREGNDQPDRFRRDDP